MFLGVLLALAEPSSGSAPVQYDPALQGATLVSPVTVRPAPPKPKGKPVEVGGSNNWVWKPPNANILSVWPEAAYRARISGKATLNCLIDAHGLAEECEVASETPPGRGFGKAALLLRDTFKLNPTMGPDGPISAMMAITVRFDYADQDEIQFASAANSYPGENGAPAAKILGTAPEMREMTILDHPVWAQAASFAEVAQAYPAKAGGGEGFGVAHCKVAHSGVLSDCEIRKEVPEGRGFGAAAVILAARFRVDFTGVAIPRGPQLWVDVPVRFPAPDQASERSVASPTWLAGFDPEKAPKLFPPEAAAKGLTTGLGMAQCVVAADGSLTDCQALPGDPDGLGFSQAAVKLAMVMRMNPWTADGRPVDGAVIRLPIRLNLPGAK